jgi:hypothetical protein
MEHQQPLRQPVNSKGNYGDSLNPLAVGFERITRESIFSSMIVVKSAA